MKQKEKNNNRDIAYGGLLFGLLSFMTGLSDLDDEAGYLLLVFGIVFMLSGGGFLIYKKIESDKLKSEALNRVFYNLIQQNSGKISLVQFASATNLPPKQARVFLENKASDFGTVVDVDNDGVITYIFK